MADKTSKSETKRLPKGQRTHIRRLKEVAGKEVSITNPKSSPPQPVKAPKKQEKI